MAYTTEKISGNQVRFDFTIPAEQFDEAMQKAYLQQRGRINVPGFRKGKAPRKLIENMYGEAVFYDAAFDIIFPEVYSEAVEAEKTDVVDQPSVDLKEIGSGKDLVFSATVYVYPDVELGEYKGLKATKYVAPVTQEQVDARVQQDVRKVTTTQDVSDRAVKEGDTVNLNYSGSVEGVKFQGGTAENQRLKIGSGSFIPGFEEQMVGMEIGEEKDLTVTFPEQYHAEELAGKDAVFHVKVNAIQEEVVPELDDDFAQDVSEHQTYQEYLDAIRKELEEITEKNAEVTVENNLIQQAVDASDCDIPDAMVEREIDAQVRNMKMRMAYQGLRYEDYLKYTGMTEEAFRDMHRADSANNVKTQLVIDAIRKQEKVEASEDEVNEEIDKRAEEIGRDKEEYRASLSDTQKENFKDLAAIRKVIDILKKEAKVEVKNEEPGKIDAEEVIKATEEAAEKAEKKSAKKPARKSAKKAEEAEEQAEEAAEESAKPQAKKAKKTEEPKE